MCAIKSLHHVISSCSLTEFITHTNGWKDRKLSCILIYRVYFRIENFPKSQEMNLSYCANE